VQENQVLQHFIIRNFAYLSVQIGAAAFAKKLIGE
jgi:hypothetical protein